jgi:hypothetical protein
MRVASIPRDRIVATAQATCHRQIPVIQQSSAVTNRAAIDIQSLTG